MRKHYDIIIAGLGEAGSAALCTAKKYGLTALGIDRFAAMGGTHTIGATPHYYFGSPGGVYEDFEYEANKHQDIFTGGIAAQMYAREKLTRGETIDVLYNAVITRADVKNKKVNSVTILLDNTEIIVDCKFLLDCTGDGEVSRLLGAEYTVGRAYDHVCQPFTRKEFLLIDGKATVSPNDDTGHVNALDIAMVSKTFLETGAAFLDEKHNENCIPLGHAPLLGVRESALIKCERTLTLQAFFNKGNTSKPLFYAQSDLDRHGTDLPFEDEILCDWAIGANLGAVNISVGIPLEIMVVSGFENLLIAGRCMGLDHNMMSCVRMQRDMQKAGEAVTTAVYLSVKNGSHILKTNYDEMSGLLRQTGCLSDEKNIGFAFGFLKGEFKKIKWLSSVREIKAGLSTLAPGVAIWSCKLLCETIVPHLIEWLDSNGENLRKHSAIALAISGRREGVPILLKMVEERDLMQLTDCRKNNQFRFCAAIYGLRKLREISAIKLLEEIVQECDEKSNSAYEKVSVNITCGKNNDVYSVFKSHAEAALVYLREQE